MAMSMSIVDIGHADVVAAAPSIIVLCPLLVVVVTAVVSVSFHCCTTSISIAIVALLLFVRLLVRGGHITVRDVLGTATSISCPSQRLVHRVVVAA